MTVEGGAGTGSKGQMEPEEIRAWAVECPGLKLKPWSYRVGPIGPNEVDVEVSFCGVCGTDIEAMKDLLGVPATFVQVQGEQAELASRASTSSKEVTAWTSLTGSGSSVSSEPQQQQQQHGVSGTISGSGSGSDQGSGFQPPMESRSQQGGQEGASSSSMMDISSGSRSAPGGQDEGTSNVTVPGGIPMKDTFMTYPFVPGHEVIGHIVRLGELASKDEFLVRLMREGIRVGVGPLAYACHQVTCPQCAIGANNVCPCKILSFCGSREKGFSKSHQEAPTAPGAAVSSQQQQQQQQQQQPQPSATSMGSEKTSPPGVDEGLNARLSVYSSTSITSAHQHHLHLSHGSRATAEGGPKSPLHAPFGGLSEHGLSSGRQYGGWAERIRVHKDFIFPIPAELPSEVAAPLLCQGLSAYAPLARHLIPRLQRAADLEAKYPIRSMYGLSEEAKMAAYDSRTRTRVGIVGTGGLGSLAVSIAKALGASLVVAFTTFSTYPVDPEQAPFPDHDRYLKSIGADYVFHFDRYDPGCLECQQQLDLILVTSPDPSADLNPYLHLLRPNGKLIVLGFVHQDVPMPFTFSPSRLIYNQLTVEGSFAGSSDDMRNLLRLAVEKNIRPHVTLMPFSKTPEAVGKFCARSFHGSLVLARDDVMKSSST